MYYLCRMLRFFFNLKRSWYIIITKQKQKRYAVSGVFSYDALTAPRNTLIKEESIMKET